MDNDNNGLKTSGAANNAIKHNRLNAFISFVNEGEGAKARREDKASLPLQGRLIGVKDNIDVAGVVSTCGSRVLTAPARQDAEAVKKIVAAGGIVVGKTNMDEFAMGSGNTTSAFGPVLNPRDLTRVPGGSSGGSAAAVGGGLVTMALGTDTGGSIRQPAACCGVVGFKPRCGAVDRRGLLITVPPLDTIGTLTANVADAILLYEVIAGVRVCPLPAQKVKIGVLTTSLAEDDDEVKTSFTYALEVLRSLGASLLTIDVPELKTAAAVYGDISCYCNAAALKDIYLKEGDKLSAETRRRVGIGMAALGTDKLARAEEKRAVIGAALRSAYKRCDVIVTPTTPILPYKLGALPRCNPDLYTQPFSLGDVPAISIPTSAGAMTGLQIAGNEDALFGLAAAYERAVEELT